MSRWFTAVTTVQTVAVPLLLDRRAQTLAPTGGLLVGLDTTETRGSVIGGGGFRPR